MSKRRILVIGGLVLVAAGGYVVADRYGYRLFDAVAQAPQRVAAVYSAWASASAAAPQAKAPQRVVAVEVATAVKQLTPVQIEALGTVTPMASVAIKSRIDSEITGMHFADGARVKQGDLLITLDGRAIEAQILQAEGNIARDRAQIEGAERDIRRYTELVAKNATPVTNLDNAKTQIRRVCGNAQGGRSEPEEPPRAAELCDDPRADLGPDQRRECQGRQLRALRRPVADSDHHPDRAGLRHVRCAAGDAAEPARGDRRGRAKRRGGRSRASRSAPSGSVAMIENTVDAATGMVNVRAAMPNENELLWPGTLVQTYLKLRNEEAVTVPSAAVQVSQTGNFVYVIKNEKAELQPVKVSRTLGEIRCWRVASMTATWSSSMGICN